MKITVEGTPQLPETLALYDFEEENVDIENKTVKDVSGSGIDAELKSMQSFQREKKAEAFLWMVRSADM